MSVRNTVSLTRLAAVQPRRLQGNREVGKHLRGLGGEIEHAHHIAVAVERGLPGDEDNPVGADVDNLRITGRRAEFGRIDADD